MALVAVLAVLLFTLPRVQYGAVAERLSRLEVRVTRLSERLESLQILEPGREAQREALLRNLESLPEFLQKIRAALEAQLTTQPETSGAAAGARGNEAASPLESYGEDVRQTVAAISARGLASESPQGILERLVENGLSPWPDLESMPPAIRQEFRILCGIYKADLEILAKEEELEILRLVGEATERGDYERLPLGFPVPPMTFPGALRVENDPDLGSARIYRFPFVVYPELREWDRLRSEARDRFIARLLPVLWGAESRALEGAKK